MSDEIGAGGNERLLTNEDQARQMVPMKVGSAVVYLEQADRPIVVESGDEIYPVTTPQEVFAMASDVIRECVRVVGERIDALAEKKPNEISVEFSINLEKFFD